MWLHFLEKAATFLVPVQNPRTVPSDLANESSGGGSARTAGCAPTAPPRPLPSQACPGDALGSLVLTRPGEDPAP